MIYLLLVSIVLRKGMDYMSGRDYVKTQIDILPDDIIEKVIEFIAFQKFNNGMYDDDTDYLQAIPGMTESILKGKAEPLTECLDNVGWDIS